MRHSQRLKCLCSTERSVRLLILLLSLLSAIANAEIPRPNIIVIMADDLGYRDLGCYGSSSHRTPNIDRLAEGGMRFTDFYVTTSVCTPTRAAFLTGRFPQRCNSPGVLWPTSTEEALPQDEITLAEILQRVGYKTHLSGKWHLGHGKREHLPLGHGFDSWYGMPYPNDMRPGHPQELWRKETWPEMPLMKDDKVVEQPVDVNLLTQQYTADAVNFITKNHRRPFFLFLAHAMTHAIVGASPEFQEHSQNGLYGAAVEEIDWSTGEILETLRAFKLESNTLVIFTNDNGAVTPEAFEGRNMRWFWPDETHGSNAPLRGGKQATFEGGIRVPGIFYWPGKVRAAVVEETPAIVADIMPTVLEYLGLPLPRDRVYDGRSLKAVLDGSGRREQNDFYFGGPRSITGMRSGKWKLQFPVQPRWMVPALATDQPLLFDLTNDIGERHNLAKEHPDIVAKLVSKVNAYRREVGIIADTEARPH